MVSYIRSTKLQFCELVSSPPLYGLPTSCLIVIWKSMELFDRYFTCLYLHKLLRVVLCSISWVVGIFGSIFSIFSWEIYNLATLGLLGGLGTMILANVREALLACRKTRTDKKTGKNFLNACVEKIAPPVLQALAFASIILPALQYFETSLIVAAWSGLFFVWEGIIICGLNNKTAALSRNWNAIFKILASVSFWAVSGNFDPGIIFLTNPSFQLQLSWCHLSYFC